MQLFVRSLTNAPSVSGRSIPLRAFDETNGPLGPDGGEDAVPAETTKHRPPPSDDEGAAGGALASDVMRELGQGPEISGESYPRARL